MRGTSSCAELCLRLMRGVVVAGRLGGLIRTRMTSQGPNEGLARFAGLGKPERAEDTRPAVQNGVQVAKLND
jgi:hypothetical protein